MIIKGKINVLKIPKHLLFKGEKGTYLDIDIVEKREPDQYGKTHSISVYDKETKEKIYIGDGTVKEFGNNQTTAPAGSSSHPDDDLLF
jgi:hypothetical protein